MVVGGGLIWLVRVLGRVAFRKEAMGFGDVMLMGMIGAYLGWQAALLVFLLAPFLGIVVGLVQMVRTGQRALPYGPYLSLAAVAMLFGLDLLWPAVDQHMVAVGQLSQDLAQQLGRWLGI